MFQATEPHIAQDGHRSVILKDDILLLESNMVSGAYRIERHGDDVDVYMRPDRGGGLSTRAEEIATITEGLAALGLRAVFKDLPASP